MQLLIKNKSNLVNLIYMRIFMQTTLTTTNVIATLTHTHLRKL